MRRLPALVLLALIASAGNARADGLENARAAAAAEKVGDRGEALRRYSLAIASGDLTGSQLAEVYYRRGAIRGALGENQASLEDFSTAIILNPQHGHALSLRGYVRGIEQQYAGAEADHRAAMAAAPQQGREAYLAWALQHYADLKRRQGLHDQALDLLERAFQLQGSADVYFRRAWVFLDMGQPARAREDFNRFAQVALRNRRTIDAYWPDERSAIEKLEAVATDRD